jgi:hypothetical protein
MATETGVKLDEDKIRMDLVPPELMEEVGKVLTFGAKKYTPNGWKTVPNGNERYMAALLRHLMAHQKGEVNDPESGLSHLSHAATNIAFLISLKTREKEPTTEKVA